MGIGRRLDPGPAGAVARLHHLVVQHGAVEEEIAQEPRVAVALLVGDEATRLGGVEVLPLGRGRELVRQSHFGATAEGPHGDEEEGGVRAQSLRERRRNGDL